MLGKLIKYEFKSTSRTMWFLYAALIVVGGLLGFMFRLDSTSTIDLVPFSMLARNDNRAFQIIISSLAIIYMFMIMAIFIMTFVMIITRFNRNLLGDEGYLMHTLPVKTHNLILSKGIVAVLWGLIATVAGILSMLLFSLTSGLLGVIFKEVTWSQIWGYISEVFSGNTALGLIATILSSVASIFAFYFAMAIGNLANKNKFLYAVIAYVVIQIVLSVIMSIIGVQGGGLFGVLLGERNMSRFLVATIIQQLILSVAFFFGTNYILKNKLNLA